MINDGKYMREHLVLYASLSSEGGLVTYLGQQREFVGGWALGLLILLKQSQGS